MLGNNSGLPFLLTSCTAGSKSMSLLIPGAASIVGNKCSISSVVCMCGNKVMSCSSASVGSCPKERITVLRQYRLQKEEAKREEETKAAEKMKRETLNEVKKNLQDLGERSDVSERRIAELDTGSQGLLVLLSDDFRAVCL